MYVAQFKWLSCKQHIFGSLFNTLFRGVWRDGGGVDRSASGHALLLGFLINRMCWACLMLSEWTYFDYGEEWASVGNGLVKMGLGCLLLLGGRTQDVLLLCCSSCQDPTQSFRILLWLPFMLFPGLIIVLSGEEQGKMDLYHLVQTKSHCIFLCQITRLWSH